MSAQALETQPVKSLCECHLDVRQGRIGGSVAKLPRIVGQVVELAFPGYVFHVMPAAEWVRGRRAYRRPRARADPCRLEHRVSCEMRCGAVEQWQKRDAVRFRLAGRIGT